MQSMTGYAVIEESYENLQISIEIKSLNNRFLDIYCEIPSILNPYDNEIRSLVSNYTTRGKIKISINIKELDSNIDIKPNVNLAKRYCNAFEELLKELGLDSQIKLEHMLRLEGVFNITKNQNSNTIWEKCENLLHKSLEQFVDMKTKEGKAIEKNIINILDEINKSLIRIKELMPHNLEHNINRVKERVTAILKEQVGEERILMEVAIISSKVDINEEVERLSFHIQNFGECCVKDNVIGKKLDFISQEMLREMNTISSKANNLEISNLVVNMKNDLEKIKEQIRNVE